ncbi:MAG: hypothetical protein RR598_08455 [Anaerorhabdus sp.]|uniref:hypothetical protein n=1 Tax=Anaerorhabdus sp. TaxID=1872524 RepID=UPI002FCB7196
MKNKIKLLSVNTLFFITTIANVSAKTPSFNEGEAKSFVEGYMEPFINIGLWLVPLAAAVSVIALAVKYFSKSEDEREQKPFIRHVGSIIVIAIIAEAIQVLLKIFGI